MVDHGLGKDSCNGETGGPLVFRNPSEPYYQVGILSYGAAKCGIAPAGYTRIVSYLDWIGSKLES